jgi:hypothetical protein
MHSIDTTSCQQQQLGEKMPSLQPNHKQQQQQLGASEANAPLDDDIFKNSTFKESAVAIVAGAGCTYRTKASHS